jgi:hypothetical protein
MWRISVRVGASNGVPVGYPDTSGTGGAYSAPGEAARGSAPYWVGAGKAGSAAASAESAAAWPVPGWIRGTLQVGQTVRPSYHFQHWVQTS